MMYYFDYNLQTFITLKIEMEVNMKIYEKLGAISLPLGGIGAGSVGLTGEGRLIDWEIFNRPNRQTINSFTHFAIKAENEKKVFDCRVLQGDTSIDFMGGSQIGYHSWGNGFGLARGTMAGMRHFKNTKFSAYYPLAEINYEDDNFPGKVKMSAFNPFIPLNDKDSSIPAAFFDFAITNNLDEEITYTIAFSCNNVFQEKGVNEANLNKDVTSIKMYSDAYDNDHPKYGSLHIATDCSETSYQEYWYRSGWFDELTTFWREFSEKGELRNRKYTQPKDNGTDICTLTAKVKLKAKETKNIRFLLTWYMPNVEKYWDNKNDDKKPIWKNYYAKLFADGSDVVSYCFENWERMYNETKLFADTLMSSTLPPEVHDAIQGNIAILKSSTCLRLPDGEFYGWEGVGTDKGSCEGSCTHVWNYAYALPFLFPDLERSMRELDYKYNLTHTGKMSFRLQLPLGSEPSSFQACVDGQMGGVMKLYRDWKICGDDEFLKRNWQSVKKSLEYAWSKENTEMWDGDKTGIITGRQHHTLDMELFGASSWLEGFYLGALKAASEMAEYLGEKDVAEEYKRLFNQGREWTENNLFNGRHYIQKINLKDKGILQKYCNCEEKYWNDEENEIKYQIGEGCEIDQVVAAWHGDLMGIENVFDYANRRSALESIYKLNFKSMRDINNPCRIFCLNDEKGAIMCNWADDVYKPKIPIPYTEETMCGFEYALACNMLQCGMEKEAVEIVKAIRERYDGEKRNPWAEIECGSSYSRSMASYSLLLTYSGFKYDMTKKEIGFKPLRDGQYFWSLDSAWGEAKTTENTLIISVLYGKISLKSVVTDITKVQSVIFDEQPIEFIQNGDKVVMDVTIDANQLLTIKG